MQHVGHERTLVVAAGKQPSLWPSEPPIRPQNPQELRRKHDVTVLAALALLDPDYHPLAINVGNLQEGHFRYTQSGCIDSGQRGTALKAWDCLQKAHDLVGTQHDRQIVRFTRIGDAFGNGVMTKGHTVEKPQRADDLVQRRPGHPRRNQMNLEGTDILQIEPVRRAPEMPAQLRDGVEVGLLRRR